MVSHMDGHDPLNARKCRFAEQHASKQHWAEWESSRQADDTHVAWEVLERLWDERDFLGERYNDGERVFKTHAGGDGASGAEARRASGGAGAGAEAGVGGGAAIPLPEHNPPC
jgi:hypothetical protein